MKIAYGRKVISFWTIVITIICCIVLIFYGLNHEIKSSSLIEFVLGMLVSIGGINTACKTIENIKQLNIKTHDK
jgi:hypothetical protein